MKKRKMNSSRKRLVLTTGVSPADCNLSCTSLVFQFVQDFLGLWGDGVAGLDFMALVEDASQTPKKNQRTKNVARLSSKVNITAVFSSVLRATVRKVMQLKLRRIYSC